MIAKSSKRSYQLYLMVIPAFALVLLFNYGPLFGISIAFKDFLPVKGILKSDWVGLYYFKYMFKLPDTMRIFKNTLIIAVLKILLGFPVPIIFALLLNEIKNKAFKKSIQTLIYLPNFLSWVILGGIVIDIFSLNGGLVNSILSSFGIDPIFFLGDNRYFRGLLIGTDVWKNFGFSTVIYMAALAGINPSLYEASLVDGANRWQQTIHITIPSIMGIVMLNAILSLGNILNAGFDQIFNLYSPLVYETADIIDTYVYRISLIDFNYSLGTAVGLLKSVVSFILITVSYGLAYKFSDYRIF